MFVGFVKFFIFLFYNDDCWIRFLWNMDDCKICLVIIYGWLVGLDFFYFIKMIFGLGVNEVFYVVGFHYLKSMETHSNDVIIRNVCKRYFLCWWFIFWLAYRLRCRLLRITYLFLYLAFHNLAKKCVIALCRSLTASGNEWLDTFL